MIRRIPIIPTLIVLAAVAVMVRLGFWQLDRLGQKEALLVHYQAAQSLLEEVAWPRSGPATESALFRRSAVTCERALQQSARAGRNDRGESGWTHVVRCELVGGGVADIAIGWSQYPPTEEQIPPGGHGFRWNELGAIHGIVGPFGKTGAILIANPPVQPLQPNAKPDPSNIPNNHLAYAVQWFLFALTALVIYALALRKRLAQSSPERGGGAPKA